MTDPEPWRCRWCHYWPPTQTMRDQHARECPYRPQETK